VGDEMLESFCVYRDEWDYHLPPEDSPEMRARYPAAGWCGWCARRTALNERKKWIAAKRFENRVILPIIPWFWDSPSSPTMRICNWASDDMAGAARQTPTVFA